MAKLKKTTAMGRNQRALKGKPQQREVLVAMAY
ncbi:hypothetical protein PR002_g8304 [Phytophthora rubi]|uniref:Uncharacterized protein n=1 Tax=Phytophthora rubi TaxID=129364 RepID=A0A6A3N1J9_9STRA|nr:hypothetical protein PR002_g8304 [Phytophthora rubi]